VLAGAGTGKTRTLVARAAWLRGSQGVPAGRILLLTFTRRAASEHARRAAPGGRLGRRVRADLRAGRSSASRTRSSGQHAESFSLPPQFHHRGPG